MRKPLAILIIFSLALVPLLAIPALAATPVTIPYSDVTVTDNASGNFTDTWDLSQGDLVLSSRVDLTGIDDSAGAHAWSELGVRAEGYGNFNPTWASEGAGVWLATDYDWSPNTFDPDPVGSPTLDLDDKLILQKGGGWDESHYDLPSTPPAPGNNHRVWFDRDGVDQWQDDSPLAVDGGTYNTGGIYDVVITMHSTGGNSATAYMTINDLDQGFEVDGNWNTMELSPAGMDFTGDMQHMQVFYGIWGYGATHTAVFKNITVTGVPASPVLTGIDPNHGKRGDSTEITISGEYFRDTEMSVQLQNGTEVISASSVTYVSPTEVNAVFDIPSNATVGGGWDVVLTHNDDGQSAVLTDAFSVEITIDIVPGSCKNLIWLNAPLLTPVAIISGGGFNATTVIPSSVVFAGANPASSCKVDVNCDGQRDLLLWFKNRNLNLTESSTTATLTATTTDGKQLMGTDSVTTFRFLF